ncbi:amino acid adenylation domain-containing protein [Amycolatopsis mongoliensis]|uniref:Amino acid adenylation domain-containing protein n=1 Tax=Amycolatopsis mongoliensis TaxID=715475 RepID=A0A9Y2JLW6_9PSEU|nr:non-ribosomal peptide synthetase [Amycolatopsis sp. 4-36]WIY00898.1 amino acid adenylation domain-containing protein [Amycolatopsis sp. 4-36]
MSEALQQENPVLLHHFFEQSARRTPDAIAVDVPPSGERPRRTVTYRDLYRRSAVAARAVQHAVRRPGIVAILLSRTTEDLYLAQLGVLRAGSAYVCLDPSFPDEQLAHILGDAAPALLVTDRAGQERAVRAGYTGAVHRVDGPAEPAARPGIAPGVPPGLAYVIYTSGTTGKPKGVLVGHQGVVNLIRSDVGEFGLGPGDRVAQGSSPAYDSSVEEAWMAWACGATVVVMDDETARLGPDLVPWLRRERITVLCPPPTLLRATACEDPRRELPELRLLYVGGEALPGDVAERWAPGRRMVNGYGPTECTVTCLRADVEPGKPVAIGKPVPGMRAWVLDERLEPVKPGEKGELCMSGTGLALGYHNKPELTDEKFPRHPRLGRLYRTGDLVHAEADGTLFYHGRIDSQVKLRGYRIELEAIEASLARFPGVREAACRVQGEGAGQVIAAHLVPDGALPDATVLKEHLRKALPAYMVPAVFGEAETLPRSAGGKLRRNDLPALATGRRHAAETTGTETEEFIAAALRAVFETDDIGIDDDFFDDLGGSSLQAAMLISKLRVNPLTEAIAVRDVYRARTVSGLAKLAAPAIHDEIDAVAAPARRAVAITLAQAAWLAAELAIAAPIGYFLVFVALPWLAARIGLVALIVLLPVVLLIAGFGWTPVAVFFAVRAKRLLIGKFEPTRVPVWSGFHLRLWIVRHLLRFVPWGTIAGTEFQCMALRSLGARIGRRVHIHRGVDVVQGGWDLLDIGDDATIGQDASLGLVQLAEGHLTIGRITVAGGATVDVRAGMSPNTRLGRGSWLSALSSLPSGTAVPDGRRWDGVPAHDTGPAPRAPVPVVSGSMLSPFAHGLATVAARALFTWLFALPLSIVMIALVLAFDVTYAALLDVVTQPWAHPGFLLVFAVGSCLSLVISVWVEALCARALGRVEEGVISRWSPAYIRVSLKTGLVTTAGNWLSGGMFWPVWLRWAGMKVGRGCEISTIIDVVPELVEIGPDTFFADGIYLGGPRIQQGTVTLARVRLGHDTFLGNHAVIPGGQRLPPDILIGVCTVADDRIMRPGTSWFGHPPMLLPRREIVESDRSLTHDPSFARVLTRVFWEWLRFALPVVPLAVMTAWFVGIAYAAKVLPLALFLFPGAALVTLATLALPCLIVLALKWGLLGRVKPGVHPLWSCWCSRWDFLYVAWGFIAGGVLSALEGTLMLPLYLRRIGVDIGKRVVLGEGFAQVVDPDMLHFGDGATVSAMFQAHTFEDRVLKIDHVHVGAHSTLAHGTVPLYGAEIGEHAYAAPHSVIMKQERLLPRLRYAGVPTKEQKAPSPRTNPESLTQPLRPAGRHRTVPEPPTQAFWRFDRTFAVPGEQPAGRPQPSLQD